MTALHADKKRHISSTLLEAGAILPCPRCGDERFEVLDGYLMEHMQNELRNMVVGGDNRFVTVATVCTRCGFLAQHALTSIDEGRAGEGQGRSRR